MTNVQSGVVKHHVRTKLDYHKPNEDGSPTSPVIIEKPETYVRPTQSFDVTVYDITGEVNRYTLDGNGFQIYTFPSAEKDFNDREKIKSEYYAETDRLLKEA